MLIFVGYVMKASYIKSSVDNAITTSLFKEIASRCATIV